MLPLDSSLHKIIAGHIPVTELQRAGLKHASCMVGVRAPVDRAISCLHYNFSTEMEGVQHMSDSKFYRTATENTQSNYAAAYMLASGTAAISEMEANTIHQNASASKAVAAFTVKILERCVVISLSDVADGQPRDSVCLFILLIGSLGCMHLRFYRTCGGIIRPPPSRTGI